MEHGPYGIEEFDWSDTPPGDGLFIVNGGNFMYGSASLSYYIPSRKEVAQEIFYQANGERLGDAAQSMVMQNGRGYVTVNNSGIIFIIDINNAFIIGTIEGLASPRYIHFLSDTKAYVTDLFAAAITIFNPKTGKIMGRIETEGHPSTEQMAQYGKYVFVSCWSYDNKILVIDTELDAVVDEIEVGIQPASLVIDKNNKIWTLTDGGYEGSPYGWEAPALYRIDAETRQVETRYAFDLNDYPSEICLNGEKDTLYFINRSIWKMNVTDEQLPQQPFLLYNGVNYWRLGVNPVNSEVYAADAIDYVQPGTMYRFSPTGEEIDSFKVGIIPSAFCFR